MDALNSEENYLNGKKRIAHKSQTTEESVTKRKEIIKGIRNSYISKNKKNDKIQIKKRSKLLTLIRTSLEKRGNQQIILDTRVSSNMKSPKHYGVQHFGDNIKQASPKGMDNKPNKRNEDLATKTVKAKRPFYESNLVYSDISSSEEGEFSSSPKKAKIVSLTRKESEVITPAKIYKKSPLASKLNSNRSSLDSFYSAGTDVWDELSNLSTDTSEIVKEDKLNEPRDIKIVDEYTIGDFPKGSDDYDSCKSVVKNNSETENLSSSLVPQNKELNSDVQSQLEEIKNKTKNKLVSIKHESSIEQPVKENLTKLITPKFELPPRTKEELAQQSKIIESYYEYDSTDDEDPDAIPDPVTILSSTLPEAPNVLMTAPKIEALPEPKIRIPPLSINSSTLDSSNQVVDITSDDEEMKNVEKVIHTTLTPPVTPSTTPFSPVDIMVTSNVLLSPAVMGWSSNNDDEVIVENDDEVIVENDDEVIVENDDTIDLTTDLANFLNAEIDLTNDVSNSTYKVAQLVVSKSNSETMAIPIFTGTIFPQITPQLQTPDNQYNTNTTDQLYGLPFINEKSDNLKVSPKQTYSASFYPQNSSTNLTNLTNKVTSPTGNLAQGFVSTPNSNLMTISTYVPQVQIMHNIKLKPFLHGTTKQSRYCDKMLQRNKLLDYYKCMDDDCYFTTNELEEFVIHLGKHQSSKSCKICPYCDFSVLQGDSSFLLLEHMVKNHNTKPQYQCGFCFHRAESINEAVQHKNAYHTMNNQVIHEIADRAEGKGRKMPLFEDQVQYVQVNQNHANPQKIYIAPNYSNPMTDTSEKQSSVYNQQPNPNQKHTPPTIWVRDTKHLMNTSVNNSSGYYNQNMSNLPQSEHQNTSYSTNGQNAGYQVQAANSLPTQMNNSQTIPFGEQFGTNSYIRYNFN